MNRFVRRTALVLASAFVGLVLFEVALRCTGVRPPRRPKAVTEGNLRAVDGPMQFELVPDKVQAWIYPSYGFVEERRVDAHVNSLGFRGRQFAREKRSGVTRVMCLGDSFTFGTGLSDEATWPARLQALCDGVRADSGVEIWNAGIEGSDTGMEIAYLEQRLFAFAPDVMLITYFANDANDAEVRPRKLTGFQKLLLHFCSEAPPQGFVRNLRSTSWTAEWVAQCMLRRVLWRRPRELLDDCHEDGRAGWERVKRELRRGRDLCAEREVAFIVVLYPMLQRSGEFMVTHAAYQKLIAFCRTEGIDWIDLEPEIAHVPPAALWVHPLDMHPSAETNLAAARAIASALEGRGVLARH